MQVCEQKSREEAAIPNLLFKPRQVILNSISNMSNTKTLISLSQQQRKLLLQSICQFLELNGFSKSLKKFYKEADVEKESWKSCLLNLEEMCYQFLKLRNDTKVSDGAIKEKDTKKDGSVNDVVLVPVEKENEGEKSKVENRPVDDVDAQKKKKKKSKSIADSSAQIAEETQLKPSKSPEIVSLSVPSEPEKKSKDKKKRKQKDESLEETKEDKLAEIPAEAAEKTDVSQEEKKEKSKTKKRKKSSSDENETDSAEKAALDDSKRRKTENFDQSNGTILPKTPNGSDNGILENGEVKESQKDKIRQFNGTAEPRTSANAFRRVKEEVEFVDERLQDNSYWAKDGADTGYGAKAQEVLGQVRGRDFRHEKTKKKRGSYRGGQIDLHSHSIKFNYDDDE